MPLLGDFGGSIGNCKFLYMNPLLPWVLPSLFLCYSLYSLFFPLLVGCMHLLRACTLLKGKRKESTMSNKEREGSTQGKGMLYKKKFLLSLQSGQGVA